MPKKQPLVSIIVPVYNVEPYLAQCLDSICNQTYRNLEIICVDDGSTDNSAQILKDFAARDSRFVVISQKNQGVSAARNTAMAAATGEWLTGVDSDDYLASYAIERAMQHADDDEIDIIQIKTKVFKDSDPDTPQPADYFNNFVSSGKTRISENVLRVNPVDIWGKMWRKAVIDKHHTSFPIGLWYEDQFFWNIIAPHCNYIYFLDDVKDCYHYRLRDDSIMGQSFSNKSRKVVDLLHVLSLICEYWSNHTYLRSKFGYAQNVPSPIEINIAIRLYENTLYTAPRDMMDEIWELFKDIAHKYCLHEQFEGYPDLLAVYCHVHPAFASRYVKKEHYFWERIDVLTQRVIELEKCVGKSISRRLKIRLALIRLKCIFSWGKRRIKYAEKKKQLKQRIRVYKA